MAHHKDLGNVVSDGGMWAPDASQMLNITACRLLDPTYTVPDEIKIYDQFMPHPIAPECSTMVCIAGPCTMMEIDYQTYSPSGADAEQAEASMFGIPACRAVWGRGMSNELSGNPTQTHVPVGDQKYYKSEADVPLYAWAPIDGTDDPALMQWHALTEQDGSQCALPDNMDITDLDSILSDDIAGSSQAVHAASITDAKEKCSPIGAADSDYRFMTIWSNDAAYRQALASSDRQKAPAQIIDLTRTGGGSEFEQCLAPLKSLTIFSGVSTGSDIRNTLNSKLEQLSTSGLMNLTTSKDQNAIRLSIYVGGYNAPPPETVDGDITTALTTALGTNERSELKIAVQYLYASCDDHLYTPTWWTGWEAKINTEQAKRIEANRKGCSQFCAGMENVLAGHPETLQLSDAFLNFAWFLRYGGVHTSESGINMYMAVGDGAAVSGYGVYQAKLNSDGNFTCADVTEMGLVSHMSSQAEHVKLLGEHYQKWENDFDSGVQRDISEVLDDIHGKYLDMVAAQDTNLNKLAPLIANDLWRYLVIRYAVCTPTQMIPPYYYHKYEKHGKYGPTTRYETNPLWMPKQFDRYLCCEPITLYTRGILKYGAAGFFNTNSKSFAPSGEFNVEIGFDPGENYHSTADPSAIIENSPPSETQYSFVCRLSTECNPITNLLTMIPLTDAPAVFRRDNALAKSRDRMKAGNLPLFPLGQSTILDPDTEICTIRGRNNRTVHTELFGRDVIQGGANVEFNAVACSVWGYCNIETPSQWTPWDTTSSNSRFTTNASIELFQDCCVCVRANYIIANDDPNALYAAAANYKTSNGQRQNAIRDNSQVPLWNTDTGSLLAPCALPIDQGTFCNDVTHSNNTTPLSHYYTWSGCIMAWHELINHMATPCAKTPDYPQDQEIDTDLINKFFRASANGDDGLKKDTQFSMPLRGGHDHGTMKTAGGINRLQRAVMLQFGKDIDKYPGRAVFMVHNPEFMPDTGPGPKSDNDVFWNLTSERGTTPDVTDPCLQRAGPAAVSFNCNAEARSPNIYRCTVHIETTWDQKMPEPLGCTEVTYSASYANNTLKQAEGGYFPEPKQPYDWDRCNVPTDPEVGFKPQNPCRKNKDMTEQARTMFAKHCNIEDGQFNWTAAGESGGVCLTLDQHCAGPYCPTKAKWDDNLVWPCGPTSCGRLGFTQFHRGDMRCYALFAGDDNVYCNQYKNSDTTTSDIRCEAWDPSDLFRWCTDDTMHRPDIPPSDGKFMDDGWSDGTGGDLYKYDKTNRLGDMNGAIFAECCTNGYTINPLEQDQASWPTGYTTLNNLKLGSNYAAYHTGEISADIIGGEVWNYLCTGKNSHTSTKKDIRGLDRDWKDDFIRGSYLSKPYGGDHHLGHIEHLDHTGVDYELSGQSSISYDNTGGIGTCSELPPIIRTLNDGMGSLYNEPHNWGAFLNPGGGDGQVQYVIDAVEWDSYESVALPNRMLLRDGNIHDNFESQKYNMPGIAPFVSDASFSNAPATPVAGTANQTTFYSNTVGKDSSYSCDCGRARPVYACAKYTAEDMDTNGWFGNFRFSQDVASAVDDYMMCGWSWDLPPSAGPFSVGLYIPSGPGASTMTTIERDPLGSGGSSAGNGTADDDLRRFFLDQRAPIVPDLNVLINNQAGLGNDFAIPARSKDTVGGTNRVRVVSYPGSCIRWPYGRVHRSMLGQDAQKYFPYETRHQNGKFNGGLSYVGDEALYGYCERTGPDEQFVFCNHDVMSLEDRETWCDIHPEANSISVGAVMGTRDITDACNDSICVFIAGDQQWPSPTALWEAWNKPDTTVIVAPFSAAVALGMQAGVVAPSIVKQKKSAPKKSIADQMGSHRFSDPVHNTSVPDAVLAVDMDDLLAVASLRALAAQPNVTISYQSVVDRLTRLHDRALAFNDYATKQRTDMGAAGCSSGWYTPILGEFLPGDNHWENYACGASSDFEPRMPPMQRVTLPGSTLASGAPGVPIVAETTATQCNAIRIFAPRFTAIDGINVTNAAACTITGLTAVPVLFGPGDNRNTTMAISVENPKTAAVAIVGYDQAVPKPTDAVANMSGSEFDITVIDPPSDYLGHIAAAIVHATGDIRVSCAEECTVVIQDVAANKRVAVTSNWAVHTLDVTDVTQVFGKAYEQEYFTQPPQHNTLLAITAATLGLTTVGLLIAGAFARATPATATTSAGQDGTNKASSTAESAKEKANG
jgi:hypothetical protein